MNAVMQLASDYLASTNTAVFLTGKAGTGKTTFLQQIRAGSQKKLVVAAPTGVAAINAGGMTIHSLFQIPFGPIIPGGDTKPDAHYSADKKELLSSLELLIIDEVSMVRPDVLDQIDLILRNVKGSPYPFGGVQVLLIGDLSQLSPIIRDEEWMMLGRYYATPYFFSSLVMQKMPYVRIELEHVYRQKEQAFVDILNEVRNQAIGTANLGLLNARYQPGFQPSADDPYITLTTHNNRAQQINNEFITALAGEEFEFTATIRGEFPKDAYPTETSLKLKIGAQVMFVKNDASAEKQFYNGKIGSIVKIESDTVYVQCGNDDKEIAVQAVEWTNIKYQLEDEQISESNAGSFAQVPLKLAWAITIHKSQGLSFDKAIIDVSEAFTHGQAYVALSRCRSLAGMVLRNPIAPHNIIGDPAVARFNEKAKADKPDTSTLERDRERYRLYLIAEMFNFSGLRTKALDIDDVLPDLQKDILDVAEKFVRTLDPARTEKAAAYFHGKLKDAVEILHSQLPGLVGKSKEKAAQADQLINWLMARIRLMDHFSTESFTAAAYLDLKKKFPAKQFTTHLDTLNAIPNEELFNRMVTWRNTIAEQNTVMPNMVFSDKILAIVAEKLPTTLKALNSIKGLIPQRATQHGPELIAMIRAYQLELQGPGVEQARMF